MYRVSKFYRIYPISVNFYKNLVKLFVENKISTLLNYIDFIRYILRRGTILFDIHAHK